MITRRQVVSRDQKIQIYFYNLVQNHNLGYEQFYNLGHDLQPGSSITQGYGINYYHKL